MLGSMHGIVLLCFMPLFSRNYHHILKETQFQFKTVCLVIMVLCLIVGCGTSPANKMTSPGRPLNVPESYQDVARERPHDVFL